MWFKIDIFMMSFSRHIFLRELPVKSTSAMKLSVDAQTLINKLRFPFALLSRLSVILESLISKRTIRSIFR